MGYTLNNDMQEFPMSMLADQQAAMLVHSLGCDNKIPTTWQPSSSNSNTTTAQGIYIHSLLLTHSLMLTHAYSTLLLMYLLTY